MGITTTAETLTSYCGRIGAIPEFFRGDTKGTRHKFRLCHRTPPELTKCPLTSPIEQDTLKRLYVVSVPYLGVYLSVMQRRAQNKIHPRHGGPRTHTSSGFIYLVASTTYFICIASIVSRSLSQFTIHPPSRRGQHLQ